MIDVSYFQRTRSCVVPLPSVYPVAPVAGLAATLDAWTAAPLFVELMTSMLASRWASGPNLFARTVQAVKRLVHVCYDVTTGRLNTLLLHDTKCFRAALGRRTLVSPDTLSALLCGRSEEHLSDITLDDALDACVFVDTHTYYDTVYDHHHSESTDDVSLYDHPDFGTDHAVACVLSMATTVGVLAKKHYEHINTIPDIKPSIRFTRGPGKLTKEAKWRNYLSAIGWSFLIVAEIVMCKTRNHLVRALHDARGLAVEEFLVASVDAIDPSMTPYMCYFSSLILRLFPAACRISCFQTFKSGIDFEDFFVPLADVAPRATMAIGFPRFFLDYDTPMAYRATIISHHATIVCRTGAHLWTFLTTKKAWHLNSMLGYPFAHAVFLKPFDIPVWTLSPSDLSDVKRMESKRTKKVSAETIEYIVSTLQF